MYELSFEHAYHTRDMRCLDYYNGILATGGSDKLFHMFNVKNGELQKITTSDIFEKNILSLRINRKGGSILVMVGTTDGKIYGFDQHGTPISLFQHNSAISSIDFIDNDHFVTGSWDGKAIVWEISTHKAITQFSNHKYAVCVHYNALASSVVSGSQDKALNIWNWKNGESIKRIESAHNDIIREISAVEEIGFITCSNDQTIKLWTSELELINSFTGHTSFVFSVKPSKLGTYFSGGDDKALKIWQNQECIKTIQLPASIWSIALDERFDIYTACSDGFLRVFTLDPQRKAEKSVLQAFEKSTLEAASKKSGMSAEDISKLATVQQMKTMVGKKDGQIRVFKNGSIPEAFMWQNGKWDKIGEVITEGGQQQGGTISAPKYYPGDKYFDAGEYDYIFDVDDDSGSPKTIPFNDGANALEAAEKYCMREGMSKSYIEQIRKFLMQNSSKIPRKALKEQKKEITQQNMLTTPQCGLIQYNDLKNPAALFKKISQFNSSLEGGHKLSEKQLEHCQRITQLLQNSRKYHSVKLDFKEIDTIKKLLTWPKEVKFPVWDLFRAFLAHYQSQSFFNGLDAGLDIIAGLCAGIQLENSQAIYALMFKTLSNTMIQNTNKNGVIKHAGIVFSSVSSFSKKQLQNKNLQAAFAGFLFNFSVAIYEKKLQNEKVLSDYAQIIKQKLQMDQNEENRNLMLQAIANTTFKYRESAGFFGFAKKYFINNEISKDLDLLLG